VSLKIKKKSFSSEIIGIYPTDVFAFILSRTTLVKAKGGKLPICAWIGDQ
jgi:hypothetical protein